MLKNVAGQQIMVYARAVAAGAPTTGDAANITAWIAQDAGSIAQSNDVNPTEVDAANMKGLYVFNLTQAESNGDLVTLSASTTTAGVEILPVSIYTLAAAQPTVSEIADGVFAQTGITAGGTASFEDIVKALYGIAQGRIARTGNAFTFYDDDGTTELFTLTVTSLARTTA